MKTKNNFKVITTNKSVFHDYEILSKYEAGIVLTGNDIKVCRENCGIQLKGSYISIIKGELILLNSNFSIFSNTSTFFQKSSNERKLLMHKKEILKLSQQVKEKGCTILPLSLYFKGNLVKIEIALAKGKHSWDKRETLKKKQLKKEIFKKF